MIKDQQKKVAKYRCKYCDWKIPENLISIILDDEERVFCEFCGDRIKKEDLLILRDNKVNNSKQVNQAEFDPDLIQNATKYPNGRVFFDPDFSLLFKENLIIVISRLESFFLKKSFQLDHQSKSIELTEELLDEISNFLMNLTREGIDDSFINNLHKMNQAEFDADLKRLQLKFQENKEFQEDFIIYLRWLIKRVFILITKKWESKNLTKFEGSILQAIKKFLDTSSVVSKSTGFIENRKIEDMKNNVNYSVKDMSILNKLLGYNFQIRNIFNRFGKKDIYVSLIEYSREIIYNFVIQHKGLHNNNKNDKKEDNYDLTFWIGESKDFIKKEQPNFKKVSKNPSLYSYKYAIYKLKSKLDEYFDLPYIGYTTNLNRRIKNHILDALKKSINQKSQRNLLKAFHTALKKDVNIIRSKILELSPQTSSESIKDLTGIYFWIFENKGSWKSKQILRFVIKEIIKKYFEVSVLEFHKKRNKALMNEKYLTKHYIHKIRNKEVKGTIWPNGLNMLSGGGGGSESDKNFPVLDYVALVSLGVKHEKIVKTLCSQYKENFASSTFSELISKHFCSYNQIQEIVLKPVIEMLIKDKKNFLLKDIALSINLDAKTLGIKVKEWFNGLGFNDLKSLVKGGTKNWQNVDQNLSKEAKLLRGYSKDVWIHWLIIAGKELTLEQIAQKLNVSTSFICSAKFVKSRSKLLMGKEISSIKTLRNELRKNLTITLLRQGWDPKRILEDKFKVKYIRQAQLRNFYNRLFFDERIKFDDLIKKYSSNSEEILKEFFPSKYK